MHTAQNSKLKLTNVKYESLIINFGMPFFISSTD